MSAVVDFTTESDQDLSVAFVLALPVAAWDVATFYAIGSLVLFANQVWLAASASTGVQPGTDATWTLSSSPGLDLTGSTLYLDVRANAADAYAPISIDSGTVGGIAITDAVNGKFTVTLPIAALSKMNPGLYVHSLIRLRPDGLRELVWSGTLTHSTGPTR